MLSFVANVTFVMLSLGTDVTYIMLLYVANVPFIFLILDWAEEAVAKAEILRLIYQGRFLHSNVTLGALGLPFGKTTVMHLVPRENLPEPNSQGNLIQTFLIRVHSMMKQRQQCCLSEVVKLEKCTIFLLGVLVFQSRHFIDGQ
jgi:hypothetical protein